MSVNNVLQILREGNVVIPKFFLKNYKRLNLTDSEFIMMTYILADEKNNKIVFDPKKIASNMNDSFEEVLMLIDSLQSKNTIALITSKDSDGIFNEYISLEPFYEKLALLISNLNEEINNEHVIVDRKNIFKSFEIEFGRTLSPIEYEMIMKWIEDGFNEEIINEALKEAIINDVRNFKYIDRILIEWRRKNLNSVEKIREYNSKFKTRNIESNETSSDVFKYNWLEGK